MCDKNHTLVEIEGDVFHWPYCQVEGCCNRIKLGVSDKYCHPHSGGKQADKLIDKLNEPSLTTPTHKQEAKV